MPFHPCGSGMDWLRFTYRTQMRLVAGQPPIDVNWIKCRPGVKPLPFAHHFGSRIWLNNWRTLRDQGAYGEVFQSEMKWRVPEVAPLRPCPPGPYWPTRFRPGVSTSDALTYPPVRMDADNWPDGCCQDPDFWTVFQSCPPDLRFPAKVRVQTFSKPSGYCLQADGTDFVITRQPTGRWYGEGIFGTTGARISFEWPDPNAPFNNCIGIMKWLDSPPNFVRWMFDLEDRFMFPSINPFSIYWLDPFQNGWQPGFEPCGIFQPLPGFDLKLSVSSFNPD